MKKIIIMILLSLCASTIALAGSGHGNGVGHAGGFNHGFKNGSLNLNVGNVPPGLENSASPPGLAKQGKTPPGWSKGEKRGWEDRDFWDPFDLDDWNFFHRKD